MIFCRHLLQVGWWCDGSGPDW